MIRPALCAIHDIHVPRFFGLRPCRAAVPMRESSLAEVRVSQGAEHPENHCYDVMVVNRSSFNL